MKHVWRTSSEGKWWQGGGGLKALPGLAGPKMEFDARGGGGLSDHSSYTNGRGLVMLICRNNKEMM